MLHTNPVASPAPAGLLSPGRLAALGWRRISNAPSTGWDLLLHPRIWVGVALLAAAWWLVPALLNAWSPKTIDLHAYTWAIWVDRLLLGALSGWLLARALDKVAQLTATPSLPPPPYPGSQTLQRTAPCSDEQWNALVQQLSRDIAATHRHTSTLVRAERGQSSGWGQVFLLLGGFFVLLGLLLSSLYPAWDILNRTPLFGLPWLLVGLLLQWGEPHTIALGWRTEHDLALWAYTDKDWPRLEHDLLRLLQHTAPDQEDLEAEATEALNPEGTTEALSPEGTTETLCPEEATEALDPEEATETLSPAGEPSS